MIVIVWLMAAPAANADTFTVDTTLDLYDGSAACPAGACSLRQAIAAAHSTASADTIEVPAETYALTIERDVSGESDHGSGDLEIEADAEISIVGTGAGPTIIDASAIDDRVFEVFADRVLHLRGVSVRGGAAAAAGAIRNEGTLSLTSVRVVDNEHGGIDNTGAAAHVGLRNSVIRGNVGALGGLRVQVGGATITDSVVRDNLTSGPGGGILVESAGSLDVRRTEVSGNQAPSGGGLAVTGDATAAVSDSTFSDNTATGATVLTGLGGGVLVEDTASSATFDGVTIAGNHAKAGAAANLHIGDTPDGALAVTLHRTLIAEPGAEANCSVGPIFAYDTDFSLADDDTCGLDDLTDHPSTPAGIGPLAANGGPSRTRALAADSAAVDAAGDGCGPLDQRGRARPFGLDCDIGAYERGAALFVPASVPAGHPRERTIGGDHLLRHRRRGRRHDHADRDRHRQRRRHPRPRSRRHRRQPGRRRRVPAHRRSAGQHLQPGRDDRRLGCRAHRHRGRVVRRGQRTDADRGPRRRAGLRLPRRAVPRQLVRAPTSTTAAVST